MLRTYILFTAIVLFAYCGIQAQIGSVELSTKLQQKLDQVVAEYDIPGATLAVLGSDGSLISLASGYAFPEDSIPMKPTDRILGGSTGKTFVAPIALQLVEEGKFALDDSVKNYFSDESWYKRLPNAGKITIRQLLNHTSGFPEYIIKETFGKDLAENPDKVWKPEELLSYIFDKEALFEAGKGWSYADANYILLGMIMEKVTGFKYYDMLRERILLPCQLALTSPSDSRVLTGLVQGHSGDCPYIVAPNKVIENGVFFTNPQFEWTGGGLVTNSRDLAWWAKELWGGNFLTAKMNSELLKAVNLRTGQPSESGYGMGVFVFKTPNYGILLTHGGIMFGYLTEMFYFKDHNLSIAMQINADVFDKNLKKPLSAIIREFFDLLIL